MAAKPPDRIRNVALIGHRGAGKTSLCEAILFEAGVTNRLGTVEDGSTVADYESDEQARQMSIDAAVASFEHDGRKINLIDTPGESSFVADTLAALRVVDAAVVVVNGVMGVEVHTERLWGRATKLGRPPRIRDHARPRARRLAFDSRLAPGCSEPQSSPPRSRSAPSTTRGAWSTSST